MNFSSSVNFPGASPPSPNNFSISLSNLATSISRVADSSPNLFSSCVFSSSKRSNDEISSSISWSTVVELSNSSNLLPYSEKRTSISFSIFLSIVEIRSSTSINLELSWFVNEETICVVLLNLFSICSVLSIKKVTLSIANSRLFAFIIALKFFGSYLGIFSINLERSSV